CQIQPSIGPHERTDRAVRINIQHPAGEEHFPLIGDTISISVGKFQEIGCGSRIKTSFIKHAALGKADFIRIDRTLVVNAISVQIFKQVYPELRIAERFCRFLVYVTDGLKNKESSC